jgi:hypothetical protein
MKFFKKNQIESGNIMKHFILSRMFLICFITIIIFYLIINFYYVFLVEQFYATAKQSDVPPKTYLVTIFPTLLKNTGQSGLFCNLDEIPYYYCNYLLLRRENVSESQACSWRCEDLNYYIRLTKGGIIDWI